MSDDLPDDEGETPPEDGPRLFSVEPDDARTRLDVFLAARLAPMSRSRVARMIAEGAVTVNGAPCDARTLVRPGQTVAFTIPPSRAAAPQPQARDLDILYEDDHLLVLDKPAGLVVHPGAGNPDGTLVNALLARPGFVSTIGGVERPGIVHRLDKDTSGLMVVAKTDDAHGALVRALGERRVVRVYHALALRVFDEPSGTIDAPLGRHPVDRLRMAVRPEGNGGRAGKPAVTHWRVLAKSAAAPVSLVECRLATGRTHQIRVHLTHSGHPILGDTLYGGGGLRAADIAGGSTPAIRAVLKTAARQMLHARALAFDHPVTGEKLSFEREPPADFVRLRVRLLPEA